MEFLFLRGLLIYLISGPVFAAEPTNPFIAYGVCPFECCDYGIWEVKVNTPLVESIGSSKTVGTAREDALVIAVMGEVHTRPGVIRILKSRDPYLAGDLVYVLTPMGEGQYKTMFKDQIYADSTGIMELVANPSVTGFAQWERKPVSQWWVQILMNDGTVGWTKQFRNFKIRNACGY